MSELEKNQKELFNEMYPIEKCVDNPMHAVEAMGYLKAIENMIPSLSHWCDMNQKFLIVILSTVAKEMEEK